jgi:CRP/FNR family transcriptional regulator, cyclic AMP receptor protein
MRKALHLMGNLDDVDIEWMADNGVQQFIAPGTVLIQEGEAIDALYIVLDGRLSVRTAAMNGGEIASLFSGEIVGEISFVDSHPPSASVIAVQDSHVLGISRQVLTDKLARDKTFAARLYRALAVFLADRLRNTVGCLGYGSKQQDVEPDQLDDSSMDEISLAALRFDDLPRRMAKPPAVAAAQSSGPVA